MIISALIITFSVLTLILIVFRILRGESIRDIRQEIKELKAQDVPHYFLRSLKIVFSFKGPGGKWEKRRQEKDENDNENENKGENKVS